MYGDDAIEDEEGEDKEKQSEEDKHIEVDDVGQLIRSCVRGIGVVRVSMKF